MKRAAASFIAASLLASCQTSYLAKRGDRAMDRGAYDVALADYNAALQSAPQEQRFDLDEKRRDAAAQYIRARLADPELGRSPERMRAELEAILGANLWGAESERPAVEAALAEVAVVEWPSVEAFASRNHYAPAVRRAEQLTARLGAHELRAKTARLRAAAANYHLAAAKSARSGERYFHLRMAQYFQGAATADLPEAETIARMETSTPWRLTAKAKPECAWFVALVAERMRAAGMDLAGSQASGAIVGEYSIDRCTSELKEWAGNEDYSYPTVEPYEESVREPYYVWSARDPSCTEPKCTRYDELGMCIAHEAEREECTRRERKLEYRDVSVTRYRPVNATGRREVRHRELHVAIGGLLRIQPRREQDRSIEIPIGSEQRYDDRAFWSPQESRQFDNTSLVALRTNAAFAFVEQLKQRSLFHNHARMETFISLGRQAEGAGDAGRALDSYVLSMLAGGNSSPAQSLVAKMYGLAPYELDQILRGGPLAVETNAAAPHLPAPETSPWEDSWSRHRVRHEERELGGLEAYTKAGVDLGFMIAQSPLQSATRAQGLTLRARFNRFHMFGSATARTLGGDAGGYSLGMAGIGGDREEDGFYFSWGIEYRQERAADGQRFQSFSFPVWFGAPITNWLGVIAGISPNALALGDLGDDGGARTTHHYSPVFARFVLEIFDRFYLEGGATHYLGIGLTEHPVHFDGVLGVRL